MRTCMITQKTNAVQREIDRNDNPLDTSYKIYEIMIMTVIKLKKLLASVSDGFLVVVISYADYQISEISAWARQHQNFE